MRCVGGEKAQAQGHNMRLVLDTTVLSNFALAGCANWLPMIWPGRLITPAEVYSELHIGITLGRIPETEWSWLTVLSLTPAEHVVYQELLRILGSGEAACIALAHSRGYWVLTDDRIARREALRLGVPLSGTIGALRSLVDEQVITLEEADAALKQMIQHGYRSPITSISNLT